VLPKHWSRRIRAPTHHTILASKSRWLRRSPVTAEITGSIPVEVAKIGSVAERLKALVLKTREPQGSVSSNLTASAKFERQCRFTDELIVHIVIQPHRGRVRTSKEDSFNLGNPDTEKRVDTRPSHLFYWSRSSAGKNAGFLNLMSEVRVLPRSPLGFSDCSLCCFVDLNNFDLMIEFTYASEAVFNFSICFSNCKFLFRNLKITTL